ncbi:hypothetical protein FACS1894116_03620 [Betaproteobacteria bacterium]|nr:hypothetical protein FACS1894116_03620 [Betaproteobacteria bacterium]GHU27120.1 hypothetical protein FACS189488_15220 [Betaproteobacteria bacterium]GHU29203.1 hypothetical protein FACS189497_06690 [Betaproteobacteria bacterium]
MDAAMETKKIEAEIAKMNAETMKLLEDGWKSRAEANKIAAETKWYPMVLAAGAGAAISGVMMALAKFIG